MRGLTNGPALPVPAGLAGLVVPNSHQPTIGGYIGEYKCLGAHFQASLRQGNVTQSLILHLGGKSMTDCLETSQNLQAYLVNDVVITRGGKTWTFT
jgi:hypothetical protein